MLFRSNNSGCKFSPLRHSLNYSVRAASILIIDHGQISACLHSIFRPLSFHFSLSISSFHHLGVWFFILGNNSISLTWFIISDIKIVQATFGTYREDTNSMKFHFYFKEAFFFVWTKFPLWSCKKYIPLNNCFRRILFRFQVKVVHLSFATSFQAHQNFSKKQSGFPLDKIGITNSSCVTGLKGFGKNSVWDNNYPAKQHCGIYPDEIICF